MGNKKKKPKLKIKQPKKPKLPDVFTKKTSPPPNSGWDKNE